MTGIRLNLGVGFFFLLLFLTAGFVACENEDDTILIGKERFLQDFRQANFFLDWDLNNDGLEESEFYLGMFDTWDDDFNGLLERNEFDRAIVDFDLGNADWDSWDANSDGEVTLAEFSSAFAKRGFFNSWDVDNDQRITEEEFTSGVFDLWDKNDDGLLTDIEYNTLYTRYFGL